MALRAVPAGVVPPDVVEVCRRLRDQGHRAWIVGGCLRDVLLERPASDWDLATSAEPREVMGVFRRVIPTGIEHGTVTVIVGGRSFEVTTLRGEGEYRDGRRPHEVFFVRDIEMDLARRDFTVNAVAYDPLEDRLIDPLDGIGDMERRVLRAVGEPLARFREDGLRVLRAARFVATLEFELDPATERAIPGALDTYRKVSHERIREEWLKSMKAARPSRAFEVMRATGILALTCPDLSATVGCEQNQWHAYDVWTHTMRCLDATPSEATLRMAALLHDVGKPLTRARSEKTGDFTFYHHERVGADRAADWLERYRFSRDEVQRITHLIRHHLICYAPTWSDAAVRRLLARVGVDRVDALLELARADAVGKGRDVEAELGLLEGLRGRIAGLVAAGTALGLRDLAIDGADVMRALGIPPGRVVGRLLAGLLERVVEEPALNERETLLALLQEIRQTLPTE